MKKHFNKNLFIKDLIMLGFSAIFLIAIFNKQLKLFPEIISNIIVLLLHIILVGVVILIGSLMVIYIILFFIELRYY